MSRPLAGSSSGSRLSVIGLVYALGLTVVLAHLLMVMIVDHEDWLVRSYRNRWAFRDVPSVRGSLLDRYDRVLAEDEPSFELSCVYERFRILHPVGAAVHGATLWSRSMGNEVRFGYRDDAVGAQAAFDQLMVVPIGQLLRSNLTEKRDRRTLVQAVVTLLAACSDRSHWRVRRDLRDSWNTDPTAPLCNALTGIAPETLAAQYRGILSRMRALDEELFRLAQQRLPAAAIQQGQRARSLRDHLERFRVDCFEGRRTQRLEDATIRYGELLERLARPLLREVPFELAAALRVAAQDQPGLRLEPSLQRRRTAGLPPTLAQLLGRVTDLEHDPGPPSYVADRVDAAMSSGLDELIPEDLAPTVEYQEALRSQAQRSYTRALRSSERRGTGGIESGLDGILAGAPGIRLVERDARSREQLLWSSLQVAPGADVALTIDLDLQRLLDARCAVACERWQERAAQAEMDPGLVDVGMAVVDALTGDVLALGSAPAEVDDRPRVPAVLSWRGNGSIGSIVKPFFALEQLTAARTGLGHTPLAEFVQCAGTYRGRDRHAYRCDHPHRDAGKELVTAIGKSCNVFFFQVAEGMGRPGLRRALYRVGLLPADAGGDSRYQARPPELPGGLAPAAQMLQSRRLPMTGIGYGIEASPLPMARAYAALATGSLPTLGMRRGEVRRRYPIGAEPEDLVQVVRGLEYCVERGTARRITGLREFGVRGKTGTAEIGQRGKKGNNAWFAGFVPPCEEGVQLAFCAVVYAVPHGEHGAEVAGELVADVLQHMTADAQLDQRYLRRGGR